MQFTLALKWTVKHLGKNDFYLSTKENKLKGLSEALKMLNLPLLKATKLV